MNRRDFVKILSAIPALFYAPRLFAKPGLFKVTTYFGDFYTDPSFITTSHTLLYAINLRASGKVNNPALFLEAAYSFSENKALTSVQLFYASEEILSLNDTVSDSDLCAEMYKVIWRKHSKIKDIYWRQVPEITEWYDFEEAKNYKKISLRFSYTKR